MNEDLRFVKRYVRLLHQIAIYLALGFQLRPHELLEPFLSK